MTDRDPPPDQNVLVAFAERLVLLRGRTGFTQSTVAKALGLTGQMLSTWEAGKAEPKLFQALALADLYQVKLDVLTGRADMPPATPRPTAKRAPHS